MLRYLSIIASSIVLIFLFGGCEQPLDINDLESTIPTSKKKRLSVNSTFTPNDIYNPNDNAFEVFVATTQAPTSNVEIVAIPDADVNLYEEGEWLEKLSFDENTRKYRTVINEPAGGKEYYIKVEHPEYETVEAKSIIPEKVDLLSTTITSKQSKISEFYPDFYELNLTIELEIDDPADIENYYHFVFRNKLTAFQVIGLDTITQPIFGSPSKSDQLFDFNTSKVNEEGAVLINENSSFAGAYLTDENFNGENKILTFSLVLLINPEWQIADQMRVEMYSVPQEYYDFQLSAYQAINTGNNPFASDLPTVLSNVREGDGLFSGYNGSYKIVRLR